MGTTLLLVAQHVGLTAQSYSLEGVRIHVLPCFHHQSHPQQPHSVGVHLYHVVCVVVLSAMTHCLINVVEAMVMLR